MSLVKVKAITGNLLETGEVVYLGTDGQWVARLLDAKYFAEDDVEQILDETMLRVTEITGAYAIDVSGATAIGRDRLRELIRNNRPTNRIDLGKQASDLGLHR